MRQIIPFLWFDTEAEEAAKFYTSVFPNSKILSINHYGPNMPMPEGTVLVVEFELDGNKFSALNAGPQFKFTEAISFLIECKDQKEVDYFWEKLTDGGEESQCGWLKDKYGVSWQVVPQQLNDYTGGSDTEGANRAMQAMLEMKKLDIEKLKEAYEGK